MSRVFAYCRVSTTDQTTQNQSMESKAAGFTIQMQRLIEECISGFVAAEKRPGFTKLIDRMKSGDILVVTSLIGWVVMLWILGDFGLLGKILIFMGMLAMNLLILLTQVAYVLTNQLNQQTLLLQFLKKH